MTSPLPPEALQRISKLCVRHWDRFYAPAKLGSDPVYGAVTRELTGATHGVLDIGCGIGLLAFYLREAGFAHDVTGFDYDAPKIDSATRMAQKSPWQGVSFMTGDARTGLPVFTGNVVILDILQFFTLKEQAELLRKAAACVAPGGKLIIRSCLRDDSRRYRITVAGDWFAKLTFWMKAAPVAYPDRELFESTLGAAGMVVRVEPLWGGTPFNNHLIVAERQA